MVEADIVTVLRSLLKQLASETNYRITVDDFTRFGALISAYGSEMVIEALQTALEEEQTTYPSVTYIERLIPQKRH